MSEAKRASYYEPKIDGLRFFAFFGVFLCYNSPTKLLEDYSANLGLGVDLFFCLSAYLITRLLLLELEATHKIRVGQFYVRRALRIWPLYFLTVAIVFLLVPLLPAVFGDLGMPAVSSPQHWAILKIYLFPLMTFWENYFAITRGHVCEIAAHLWTISVEEQFYVVWPAIFLLINKCERTLRAAFLFLAAAVVFGLLYRYFLYRSHSNYSRFVLDTLTRLDSFLFGIGLAYIAHFYRPTLKYSWLWAAIGLAIILFGFDWRDIYVSPINARSIWFDLLVASGVGFIVTGVALGNDSFTRLLETPVLRYLGKISFGLYIVHLPVVGALHHLLPKADLEKYETAGVLFALTIPFVLTVAISALSYEFFEKPFLKLKKRYSVINSRPA